MRPSDTGPLLKSVWVALYGAHPRAMFATSHFSVFRSLPVARGRLNPPAEMPGPAHKQKIVREFFQKRAIELQTAVALTAKEETLVQLPAIALLRPQTAQ